MNKFEKVQILSQEISRSRQEVSMVARSLHGVFFLFLTAFVGIISVYFSQEIVDKSRKAELFLILSQVEVFLGLFLALLLCYHRQRIGYIRALERKINELGEEDIIIWYSKVTEKYMANRLSYFYWMCCLQPFIYLLIFIVLIICTFKIVERPVWGIDRIFWGAFVAIEAVVCLLLNWFAYNQSQSVESFVKEKLRIATKDMQEGNGNPISTGN